MSRNLGDGWSAADPRVWVGQCSTPEPCIDNGMGYRFHDEECRWGPGVTPTPKPVNR